MKKLRKIAKNLSQNLLPYSLYMSLLKRYGGSGKGRKMTASELESDRAKLIALNTDKRFSFSRRHDYICNGDKYANNGEFDSGYFVQDIWGARKVLAHRPAMHYDVGSSVAGFVAHLLSASQPLTLIDIRPLRDLNTAFVCVCGGGGGKLTA